MAPLTEPQILALLEDGPRIIYGYPRQIYFDMQKRGLIELREIEIDSQETGVEVRLAPQGGM